MFLYIIVVNHCIFRTTCIIIIITTTTASHASVPLVINEYIALRNESIRLGIAVVQLVVYCAEGRHI